MEGTARSAEIFGDLEETQEGGRHRAKRGFFLDDPQKGVRYRVKHGKFCDFEETQDAERHRVMR